MLRRSIASLIGVALVGASLIAAMPQRSEAQYGGYYYTGNPAWTYYLGPRTGYAYPGAPYYRGYGPPYYPGYGPPYEVGYGPQNNAGYARYYMGIDPRIVQPYYVPPTQPYYQGQAPYYYYRR